MKPNKWEASYNATQVYSQTYSVSHKTPSHLFLDVVLSQYAGELKFTLKRFCCQCSCVRLGLGIFLNGLSGPQNNYIFRWRYSKQSKSGDQSHPVKFLQKLGNRNKREPALAVLRRSAWRSAWRSCDADSENIPCTDKSGVGKINDEPREPQQRQLYKLWNQKQKWRQTERSCFEFW